MAAAAISNDGRMLIVPSEVNRKYFHVFSVSPPDAKDPTAQSYTNQHNIVLTRSNVSNEASQIVFGKKGNNVVVAVGNVATFFEIFVKTSKGWNSVFIQTCPGGAVNSSWDGAARTAQTTKAFFDVDGTLRFFHLDVFNATL